MIFKIEVVPVIEPVTPRIRKRISRRARYSETDFYGIILQQNSEMFLNLTTELEVNFSFAIAGLLWVPTFTHVLLLETNEDLVLITRLKFTCCLLMQTRKPEREGFGIIMLVFNSINMYTILTLSVVTLVASV